MLPYPPKHRVYIEGFINQLVRSVWLAQRVYSLSCFGLQEDVGTGGRRGFNHDPIIENKLVDPHARTHTPKKKPKKKNIISLQV